MTKRFGAPGSSGGAWASSDGGSIGVSSKLGPGACALATFIVILQVQSNQALILHIRGTQ